MNNRLNSVSQKIVDIISSNIFFKIILIIVVAQGMWYALSFQPSMYDEARHFEFTQMYTERTNPIIRVQDPKYDTLGEITREPNYMFYYIMSWPLRLISVITSSTQIQILVLRIIGISFFVSAIAIFKKLFQKLGVTNGLIHASLGLFVLTPGVAILPGVFSYDNLMILLTAALMYLCVITVKNKEIDIKRLALIALIGLVGSPIKITFLAIYVPTIICLAYLLFKKHGRKLTVRFVDSYKKTKKSTIIILAFAIVVSGGFFVERPVYNLLVYKKMAPQCVKILSEERCSKNIVTKRNTENTKNRKALGARFKPLNIYSYTTRYWLPKMVEHQASPTKMLPAMKLFYYVFSLTGAALVLLYIRDILKEKSFILLVYPMVLYTIVVLQTNYSTYLRQALPVATNGRYLFPVLPVFFLLIAISFTRLVQHNRTVSVLALSLVLLLFTQGGGLITYQLDNFEPIYWNNRIVRQFNGVAKKRLQPIVKE